MDPSQVWPYLASVALLGLWPGPTVSSVAIQSMRGSANSSVFVILGVLSANVVYIVISALLRAFGYILSSELRLILVNMGGLTLLSIGVRYLVVIRRKIVDPSSLGKHRGMPSESLQAFRQGFLIHSSNPYTIIFFTSIFLTIVPLDNHFAKNVTLLGMWALVVDATILFAYSRLVLIIGSIISQDNALYRILYKTPAFAGVLLTALALRKLSSSLPELVRMIVAHH